MQILGLDYGTKRVGLAIGHSVVRSVSPLKTFAHAGDKSKLCKHLQELKRDYRWQQVVLGDPGPQEHHLTLQEDILELKSWIELHLKTPVQLWDETGTSQEARSLLKDYPAQDKDALAAVLILQSYLDNLDRITTDR
jgi:putative Holliday junction resolvase